MPNILIATALTAQSFLSPNMTEDQRLEKMRSHFYPPPGEFVEIDPDDLNNNKKNKDPLDYVGYITVSPPPGVCFTITRNEDSEDDVICQEKQTSKVNKKRLSFSVKHLDDTGTLTWHISTGPGDFGADYKWQTPHRLARAIPYGKKVARVIPITRCIPQKGAGTRRIVLDMMNAERWVITFPPKDVSTGKEGELMNLYVPPPAKSGAITAESKVLAPEKKADGIDPMEDYVAPRFDESVTTYWAIGELNSFVMSASNFRINYNGPPGMKGICRYRYFGAPKDLKNGWMECHDTDLYDVIFLPLTCIDKIK